MALGHEITYIAVERSLWQAKCRCGNWQSSISTRRIVEQEARQHLNNPE